MNIENFSSFYSNYNIVYEYYTQALQQANLGYKSYTPNTDLSRKIYTFIQNHALNDKAILQLIKKTKEIKEDIDSINISLHDSNVYLVELSDPSKIEIAITDSPEESLDYIKIDRLASSEIVKSKNLLPEEQTSISAGNYKFDIELDEETYEISLTIPNNETYTNKDILTILSYEINKLGTSLVSNIYTVKKRSLNTKSPDSLINYVYLQITNTQTGKDHYFILKDINSTIIKDLKLNIIDNFSLDARYDLNGKPKTSSENNVLEKDGKISLNFLQETSKTISIKISKDNKKISNVINNIINAYNDYINWINERQFTFKQQLLNSFNKIIYNYFKKLKEIDIKSDKEGRLAPGKYFKDILNADFQKVISYLFGEEGFFNEIRQQLQGIIDSPEKFRLSQPEISLYSKYGRLETSKNTTHNISFFI